MKKRKTISIILTIISFIGLLFLVIYLFRIENKKITEVTRVSFDEWKNITEANEYVVTVLGQTWCSHCETIKPHIVYIENKYNIKIYWFDMDTISKNEANYITNNYHLNYKGTPHIFILKNNELISEIAGERTRNDLIQYFKNNNVIE